MVSSDDRINETASFLPQTSDDTRPCITVGGVQVYVYFHYGILHVSVDLDNTYPELMDADGCVPMLGTVSGSTVFEYPAASSA